MIAAGGTGGGVYPALAVAEQLRQQHPGVTLSFVGSVGGFERPLVEASGVPFDTYDEVPSGPLHGVSLPMRLISLLKLAAGTLFALLLVARRRPAALLLTGGWVGLPVALAASLLRVPALIFLPDIEPGLSIQVLRRFARRVAITVPESTVYFRPGQTVVTGYPLRAIMGDATRAQALEHFHLDPARNTLLVFGGSRGARSINNALLAILPDLLADGLQIIHVTGTLDWPDIETRVAALGNPPHYHAYPYLHAEMGLAFAAADLVLSRAGASILGEFPHFGLPSILVPYPHAWHYQKVNADWLADRGAAVVIEDSAMSGDLLVTIRRILGDESALEGMRQAASSLAQPGAAARIAAELARLAGVPDAAPTPPATA